MRPRALTPDQIGMGQKEVVAKEDKKSASKAEKDLQETTEDWNTMVKKMTSDLQYHYKAKVMFTLQKRPIV
jgi:uncharacterized FlaG/YvyC family protein